MTDDPKSPVDQPTSAGSPTDQEDNSPKAAAESAMPTQSAESGPKAAAESAAPARLTESSRAAPPESTTPAQSSAPADQDKKPAKEETPKTKEGLPFALVIDDEPANCDFLVRLLEQAQMKVRGAYTAKEALDILEGVEDVALIVIDHRLPDMHGVDLLIQLRPRYPEARMVMATMHDERTLMTRAFENGCDVFLVKPHGFMELFRRLQTPGEGEDRLRRLIIDQYGPRPYRG